MNRLVALLALTSVFSLLSNFSQIDFNALKKSNQERERQVILELNNSIMTCLETADKHSAFIAEYAKAARQKNPNYDLLRDKLFAALLNQYYRLHKACHKKIVAMDQLKVIVLGEEFVAQR